MDMAVHRVIKPAIRLSMNDIAAASDRQIYIDEQVRSSQAFVARAKSEFVAQFKTGLIDILKNPEL